MIYRLICVQFLLAATTLSFGFAQPHFGAELRWTIPVDYFAKQALPGTIIAEGIGYRADFSSGIMVGPSFFHQFREDWRINAGVQAGFRNLRHRSAPEYGFLRANRRLRTLMVPLSFSWMPMFGKGGALRWHLSAGGGLFWVDRLNMRSGFSPLIGRNISVQASSQLANLQSMNIRTRVSKENQALPSGFLSASAGIEWDTGNWGGIRLGLSYRWMMNRAIRFEGNWETDNDEWSVDRMVRGSFLGFELAIRLPFVIPIRKMQVQAG